MFQVTKELKNFFNGFCTNKENELILTINSKNKLVKIKGRNTFVINNTKDTVTHVTVNAKMFFKAVLCYDLGTTFDFKINKTGFIDIYNDKTEYRLYSKIVNETGTVNYDATVSDKTMNIIQKMNKRFQTKKTYCLVHICDGKEKIVRKYGNFGYIFVENENESKKDIKFLFSYYNNIDDRLDINCIDNNKYLINDTETANTITDTSIINIFDIPNEVKYFSVNKKQLNAVIKKTDYSKIRFTLSKDNFNIFTDNSNNFKVNYNTEKETTCNVDLSDLRYILTFCSDNVELGLINSEYACGLLIKCDKMNFTALLNIDVINY